MRTSQKALLSTAAVLAGVIVVTALAGRVALSRIDSTVVEGDQVFGNPDLGGFDEVEAEGVWRVNLSRGDDWKVELPLARDRGKTVRAHVVGKRLRLSRTTFARGGWTFRWGEEGPPTRVDIVMPALAALELKGGTRVSLSGFRGDRLAIEASGAVRLVGNDARYEDLDLSLAGASDIDLRGVEVTNARVDLMGASEVVLTMNGGVLSGSSAGAGTLAYFGSVSEETIDVAGVTRIVHQGE